MSNNKTDAQLILEMKTELNELCYNLERRVASRTGQLSRRVELLESCNSALCVRLAALQEENDRLRQRLSSRTDHQDDVSLQPDLRLLSNQANFPQVNQLERFAA